jgi:hypothetical protein
MTIKKTKPTTVIEKPFLVPHFPRTISYDVTQDWIRKLCGKNPTLKEEKRRKKRGGDNGGGRILIRIISKLLLLRYKNSRIFHYEGKSANSINEFVIFCSDNNTASKNILLCFKKLSSTYINYCALEC